MAQNRMTLSFRNSEEMKLVKAIVNAKAADAHQSLSDWIVGRILDSDDIPGDIAEALDKLSVCPVNETEAIYRDHQATELYEKYRNRYLYMRGR